MLHFFFKIIWKGTFSKTAINIFVQEICNKTWKLVYHFCRNITLLRCLNKSFNLISLLISSEVTDVKEKVAFLSSLDTTYLIITTLGFFWYFVAAFPTELAMLEALQIYC